jgi:hypothetical protein
MKEIKISVNNCRELMAGENWRYEIYNDHS